MDEHSDLNYLKAWRRMFAFGGVSTRSEYWLFTIVTLVVYWILWSVAIYLTRTTVDGIITPPIIGSPTAFWLLMTLLAISFVALCVYVPLLIRRVRDAIGSGWWTLLVFVPFIGILMVLVITLIPSSKRQGTEPSA